jgi:hypothetical protein
MLRLANVLGCGPARKRWLCSVAKGQRPLYHGHHTKLLTWFAHREAEFIALGLPLTAAGRREYLRLKRLPPKHMVLRAGLPGLNTTT